MSKFCEKCGEPLKEYVGFNSMPGAPSNPWDCLNENCGVQKENAPVSESAGVQIQWPADWDITWVAVRDQIIEEVKGWDGWSSYEVRLEQDGIALYGICTQDCCISSAPNNDRLINLWAIPIQSVPTQTGAVTSAMQTSIPIQRRQGYQNPVAQVLADAEQQLAQDLALDVASRNTLPPPETDQLPSSGKPTLILSHPMYTGRFVIE
jgi:hypothetical protein